MATQTQQRDGGDWQAEAECLTADPELFFPDRSDERPAALAICGRCPVRRRCAQTALASRERFGVWGGLTERDRERWWARAARRGAGADVDRLGA